MSPERKPSQKPTKIKILRHQGEAEILLPNDLLEGITGPRGSRGLPGKDGEKGPRGLRGLPGEKGAKGSKGNKGEQGIPGENGRDGRDGIDGEKGDKGDTGEQGAQSKGNKVGLWGLLGLLGVAGGAEAAILLNNDSSVPPADTSSTTDGTTTSSSSSTTEGTTTTSSSTTSIPEQGNPDTGTEQPEDRFAYYAQDYQEAYPYLTKEQIETELRFVATISADIDPLNFIADLPNSGIERDPENGHVVDYEGPITVNVPEGAYAYISHGHGVLIAPNGFRIVLPPQENNVYHTYIRGVADDGTSTDLNQGWKFSEFATGFVWKQHAADTRHVANHDGQIINLEQHAQDLLYAAKSGTNCGATGCESTITEDFIDAEGIQNGKDNAWIRVVYYPIYGDNGDLINLAYVMQNMITGALIPQPLS